MPQLKDANANHGDNPDLRTEGFPAGCNHICISNDAIDTSA